MEKENKYSYDNWLNGQVVLEYAPVVYKIDQPPKTVKWKDFNETDIQKIKDKQKQIFQQKVSEFLVGKQENFTKYFENSNLKDELYIDEKEQCNDIMFANIPNAKTIKLTFWEDLIELKDQIEIQRYIKRTIKKGIPDNHNYIHSPNCKYQQVDKTIPQVYAQFIWEYFTWLDTIFNTKETIYTEKEQQKIWFKVGLLFANGEMDKLIAKNEHGNSKSYTEIAKTLGNKNFRPYISESISGTKVYDKNIFSNKEKTDYITKYCNINNITIADSFKKRCK